MLLRMVVMARPPFKIFLLIIAASAAKCKLFLLQTSAEFSPPDSWTLHKSINRAYGLHQNRAEKFDEG